MRSPSQYSFAQVPQADIPRSSFIRNHGYKTTFDAGYLIPIYVDEALPGDTFNLKASIFARLATPFVPVMDNMHADVFFFAVPNRLVWEHWQAFMGERDVGDTTEYLIPRLDPATGVVNEGELGDYMGLPLSVQLDNISALPFRAYNLIFNEWFRDENLVPMIPCPKDDGPDDLTDYTIQKRGKRHDYFTGSLPWPQKGPGVALPLGGSAPVYPDIGSQWNLGGPTPYLKTGTNTHGPLQQQGPSSQNVLIGTAQIGTTANLEWSTSHTGLLTDLSVATAATINQLREAFQLQKLQERDARGGTRYTEILRSHFGVVSPDARLQRPEYLGGGSAQVQFNAIPQTSGSPPDSGGYTTTPQGNLAANATINAGGIGFTKSFVEHSIIIGLISVAPDLSYQQGTPRMWSRRTKHDFYWPALAHLGEQAVLVKEIYTSTAAVNAEVWGYQERWAEYRYHPSMITGKMRSSNGTEPVGSLDIWHLGQYFATKPELNAEFIAVDGAPIKRISAVPSEPDFIFDSYFEVRCARPMPMYSVPGLVDHF